MPWSIKSFTSFYIRLTILIYVRRHRTEPKVFFFEPRRFVVLFSKFPFPSIVHIRIFETRFKKFGTSADVETAMLSKVVSNDSSPKKKASASIQVLNKVKQSIKKFTGSGAFDRVQPVGYMEGETIDNCQKVCFPSLRNKFQWGEH